jgi:hypothetical protein
MGHKQRFEKFAQTRIANSVPKPKIRVAEPLMGKNDKGQVTVLCPFCSEPHPIPPNRPAHCGTMLEVKAVQAIFYGQKCALCQGNQGALIRVGDRYRHVHDCSPGKVLYTQEPRKSIVAALAYRLPDPVHIFLGRRLGYVPFQVFGADGKVVGYTWQRMYKRHNASPEISVPR